MASGSDERHVTTGVPEWVEEWLEERAESADLSREEYVDQLIAAAVATTGSLESDTTDQDADVSIPWLLAEVESVFEHLLTQHDTDDELASVQADFGEKITDVRNRVVQLKHELAEKADEDHVHPSLREDLESTRRRVVETASEAESLRADLTAFDETVNDGFDNFETVLEYLTERADLLERRYNRLARTAVGLKQRVDSVESENANRKRADALKRKANKHGFRTASCAGCGGTVHLDLLGVPQCPHCEETFDDVEPKSGLFGSNRLTIGETPALESGDTETGFKFGSVAGTSEEAESDAAVEEIREQGGAEPR